MNTLSANKNEYQVSYCFKKYSTNEGSIHTDDIFFSALAKTGTDSRLTVATISNGMNISKAAHHSSNSRSKACFRPGGRSLGSGDMESHRSTDMAVIVNTLAATVTPETKKHGYTCECSYVLKRWIF